MSDDSKNYILKRMNIDDLPAVQDLIESQTILCHSPKREDSDRKCLDAIQYRLENDTPQTSLKLYGVFDEQRLMAMGGGFYGKFMPTWSFAYLRARPEALGRYRLTTGRIIDALIEYAESQGIYRFDYTTGVRSAISNDPLNYSSLLTRISEKAKRYEFYNEAIIEKNTRPRYDYHWFLMGQELQDVDMLMRVAELKNEFRDQVLKKFTPENFSHAP